MPVNWHELVYYDPTSPTGLRWRVNTQNKKAGDVAGSGKAGQYSKVQYAGVRWQCHKVVWLLHNRETPSGFELDHIDGTRSHNRIENIRLVTKQVNSQNKKKPVNNTSGVVGVYFCNSKWPAWQAYWTPPGKRQRGKSFSVSKYGEEGAFKMACDYRKQMINKLNSEGASYTERHGT